MEELQSRWRIKEFAAIVGVAEATLRAWERRYELLSPERSAGGFRLYTRADERRIRSMQAHMQRGISPAQAAALAVSESSRDIAAPARPRALIDALLDAADALDATRFDALLDAAFMQGQPTAIADVVLPALVEIGERWARNEMSVAHEHFASHLIERRLLALTTGWDTGDRRLALLACASGERHTLGLLCFGLLLADNGWRIAYLGADTPVGEIVSASDTLRPAVVVLCALNANHLTNDAHAIAGLGARHHTILAGSGATPELAKQLGVHLANGGPVTTAQALAEHQP